MDRSDVYRIKAKTPVYVGFSASHIPCDYQGDPNKTYSFGYVEGAGLTLKNIIQDADVEILDELGMPVAHVSANRRDFISTFEREFALEIENYSDNELILLKE